MRLKRSVLQWFHARRTGSKSNGGPSTLAPWWVRQFTEFGRPIMAVVVLVMCAPAEHHLAVVAGFGSKLGWGMAVTMAAYGGMAASVASYRPMVSAKLGAVLALAAAMAAQATAHLITTHWLYVGGDRIEPTVPWLLVILVSCAPPLILGHLLHLAWVRPGSSGQYRGASRSGAAVVPAAGPGWVNVPEGARTLALVPLDVPQPAPVPQPRRASGWVAVPAGARSLRIVPRPGPWLPVATIVKWTGRSDSTVRGWISSGLVRTGMSQALNIVLVSTDSIPAEYRGSDGDLLALAQEYLERVALAA